MVEAIATTEQTGASEIPPEHVLSLRERFKNKDLDDREEGDATVGKSARGGARPEVAGGDSSSRFGHGDGGSERYDADATAEDEPGSDAPSTSTPPWARFLNVSNASDRYHAALFNFAAASDEPEADAPSQSTSATVQQQYHTELHDWKENRRDQLCDIFAAKKQQSFELDGCNDQLRYAFKQTRIALSQFEDQAATAEETPTLFAGCLTDLAAATASYGAVMNRQLTLLAQMNELNDEVDTAGGERPEASPLVNLALESMDVVSGPMSPNVEDPEEEYDYGQEAMRTTRCALFDGLGEMRDSLSSMKKGLKLAGDVTNNRPRAADAASDRVQKHVSAFDESYPEGHQHFYLEDAEASVDAMDYEIEALTSGYAAVAVA